MNQTARGASRLSEKVEARPGSDLHGRGIFARDPIRRGELLVVWGGRVASSAEVERMPVGAQMFSLQIEEGLYFSPMDGEDSDPADFVNHSCAPNAGLSGQIVLRAIRTISPGEEICYDYAMSESDPTYEFDCECEVEECRGTVTGGDWRLPRLQHRYEGWFSPYLERRIRILNDE